MAKKSPPSCVNEAFTDIITISETAGALSPSVLEMWRRGGAVERAHVCFATLRPQLNDP